MGISIIVVENLFEPHSDAAQYAMSDSAVRVLGQQDETKLVSAIAPWTDAVFNGEQVRRLAQELRALAHQQSLDERTRQELDAAAAFIETNTAGKARCFTLFRGD